MTTDIGETTATPELTQATLPGTPEPEAVNDTPPAPDTTEETGEAEESETPESPITPRALAGEPEPEAKRDLTIDEIHELYFEKRDLSKLSPDDIDRLAAHQKQEQDNAQRQQLQQQFLEQSFPAVVQSIIREDLPALGIDLDRQALEVLQYRLTQRILDGPQGLQRYARAAFEAGPMNATARALADVLTKVGMKREAREAMQRAYDWKFDYAGAINEAYEAGQKKASLSKDDVTYDWFKKNRPDEYKKFHKDFPERGGGIKPADSRSSGGTLTPERYQAMSFDERQALRREHPEQIDAMVARASGR